MENNELPRLGEVIPSLLEQRGIEVVFGIPGVHTIELYRGLKNSNLRHITPRHEQAAGFMADGYARATGKVAACFIITGPGLLNIATAMGQALADSIPMLVITSTNSRSTLGSGEGRLHEIRGQSAIGREVSRLGFTVLTPDQLATALDRAFALFASARPGPVHIEIPIDVLKEPYAGAKTLAALPSPPAPAHEALKQAADLINAAKRPVVILGGGCVPAHSAVRSMVEAIGGPVLLTANARGILPAGHAQNAGGGLPFPPARKLIKSADVVLAIGTELGVTDFEFNGDEGRIEVSNALIRVDIDPEQLVRNATATLAITSEAGEFATALLGLLTTKRTVGEEPRHVLKAGLAELGPRYAQHLPLIESIWRVLPQAIVVGDSTASSYAASHCAEPPAPRRWMGSATGFGSLGYALPAAIGAKIANPDTPVVCLVGDGGLQFTLAELAAAADAGAPVIVLLWNDQHYGEILHYMEATKVPPVGVSLFATDFSAVAKAFGAGHVLARTLSETETAMASAAKGKQSVVIEMDAGQFE